MPEIKLLKKETPDPTKERVRCCLYKWYMSKRYQTEEKLLSRLFNTLYPKNDNIKDVLLKVCAVDSIDNTCITYSADVYSVAEHIVSLKIDKKLKSKKLKSKNLKLNLELVNEIASVDPNSSGNGLYSFASKYCARHKPDIYPMCDSRVCSMLWHFQQVDDFMKFKRTDTCMGFKRKDLEYLKDYAHFETILRKFIGYYELNDFSLRQIDIYLWLSGKEYKKK